MNKAEWLASFPATLDASTARDRADAVLTDARDTVRDVAFSYGSTVPPPPWPAHPELVTAIARLKAMRDGFDVLVRKGAKAAWPPGPPKVVTSLRAAGAAVIDQTAELLRRQAAAPRLPDLLKLTPDPRKFLLGLPVWVAIALLWWWSRGHRGQEKSRSLA